MYKSVVILYAGTCTEESRERDESREQNKRENEHAFTEIKIKCFIINVYFVDKFHFEQNKKERASIMGVAKFMATWRNNACMGF